MRSTVDRVVFNAYGDDSSNVQIIFYTADGHQYNILMTPSELNYKTVSSGHEQAISSFTPDWTSGS